MHSFIHIKFLIQSFLNLHNLLINLKYLIFQSILRHRYHTTSFLPINWLLFMMPWWFPLAIIFIMMIIIRYFNIFLLFLVAQVIIVLSFTFALSALWNWGLVCWRWKRGFAELEGLFLFVRFLLVFEWCVKMTCWVVLFHMIRFSVSHALFLWLLSLLILSPNIYILLNWFPKLIRRLIRHNFHIAMPIKPILPIILILHIAIKP